MSAVLFGVFLLFYTVIFGIIVSIKEKKVNKTILIMSSIILALFIIINAKLLSNIIHPSVANIKSTVAGGGHVYTDGIMLCIKKFFRTFFFYSGSIYHSGAFPLKYVAFPLVFSFFVLAFLERNRFKIEKNYLIICLLV